MNSKSIFLKALVTTLALTSAMSATADTETFKVAIIKNALGSKDILNGNFNSSIEKLILKKKQHNNFNKNMGLCVAYSKTQNSIKSESACTAAIDNANSFRSHNKKVRYLKSLSYSNRGISRYRNGDVRGAMDDLTIAMSIDANPITESNLKLIQKRSNVTNTDSAIELSG